MSHENLEETEVYYSNADSPLPVDDPDLRTHASIRTFDNAPPESTTNTGIEAINPLPTASAEGNKRKRKSKKSEILFVTPHKNVTENKDKEKASKIKEKAKRQQKRLEAAHKKDK
jgi:hypothetical protein